MSTQLQLRRDTTANIGAITPAQGEPIYDVSRKALVLGDGATAGGLCATPFAGTWTPQLEFGGTVVAGTTASGVWTQIGNLVFFYYSIQLTAKNGSGGATIAGLQLLRRRKFILDSAGQDGRDGPGAGRRYRLRHQRPHSRLRMVHRGTTDRVIP